MRIALVPGTWGLSDPWWTPDSLFVQALTRLGYTVIGIPWPGMLGGFGPNRHLGWRDGAKQIADVLQATPADVLLAHSHAGNAAAIAVAGGAQVPLLVTVCTPHRHDLTVYYETARWALTARGGHWRHLYSRHDPIQQAGAFLDGAISFRQTMPLADENIPQDRGHHAGAWFTFDFPLAWLQRPAPPDITAGVTLDPSVLA